MCSDQGHCQHVVSSRSLHCRFHNTDQPDLQHLPAENFTSTSSFTEFSPKQCIMLILEIPGLKRASISSLPVGDMDQLILEFSKLKVTATRVSRSPAVTIDHLPAEILANIFEYLSNDDIYNLPHRICAKGLFEKEGRLRFAQHRTWIDRKNLQQLTRISYHPTIRNFVQELIVGYEMPYYVKWKQFLKEQWMDKHSIRSQAPREITLRNFHTLARIPADSCPFCDGWPSLTEKWIAHKSALKSLQELQNSGKDVKILEEALRRFKGFNAITIDNWVRRDEERRKSGLRYFHVPESYRNYLSPWPGFSKPPRNTVLTTLIKVLSNTHSKPSSFEIMGNAESRWYHNGMLSAALNTYFHDYPFPSLTISNAFINMKRMQLRGLWGIYSTADDPSDPLTSSDKLLVCMLRSAVQLEELTLSFSGVDIQPPYTFGLRNIPLGRYPGTNRFRRLKTLHLAHFRLEPSHMDYFLKATAKSLMHLTLEDILLSGHWESAFDKLKGIFKLQSLHLQSLKKLAPPRRMGEFETYDTPYQKGGDEEALAWLCGRSETNPFRQT